MEPVRKLSEVARDEARKRQDERLDDVVARVREDARREPERYLRDSEVPAGGE